MIDTWTKYCYTAILCLNHVAFAMTVTAIGPVLTIMVDILDTSPQYMTMFTTFTSTGFLIGSFFCFLLKYLNRQLVWISFVLIMAISVTIVPHSPNLITLYGCATGIGLGAGVLSTILNVWIIEMWKQKSPSILQIPGLTFGVGAILSPLIIKPYLRVPFSALQNSSSFDFLNDTNLQTKSDAYNEVYEEWRRSLLTKPFIILGLIQVLFPIIMFVMFILKRYEYSPEKVSFSALDKDVDQEYKLFDRQRKNRKIVIILFAILVGVFNVNECAYYTFGTTYFQYSPLQLTPTKAAEMITAFTIPYTIFRGLSCLIAVKVLPKYMLSANFLVSMTGFLFLFFSQNSQTLLWFANVIIGIGLSALMQTLFAFIGQHIRLTDQIGTILFIILGSFNIAPPYLLGLFIKDHSISFVYVEAFTMVICIVLFIISLVFIWSSEKAENLKKNLGQFK